LAQRKGESLSQKVKSPIIRISLYSHYTHTAYHTFGPPCMSYMMKTLKDICFLVLLSCMAFLYCFYCPLVAIKLHHYYLFTYL